MVNLNQSEQKILAARTAVETLVQKGLIFSGTSPDGTIAECAEYPHNDFYLAVQSHPEFKSRPNAPHPLFLGFVAAAMKKYNS